MVCAPAGGGLCRTLFRSHGRNALTAAALGALSAGPPVWGCTPLSRLRPVEIRVRPLSPGVRAEGALQGLGPRNLSFLPFEWGGERVLFQENFSLLEENHETISTQYAFLWRKAQHD